ncbi:MAG: hypothetical protein AAFU79_08145 [Myxococcota bacterium]
MTKEPLGAAILLATIALLASPRAGAEPSRFVRWTPERTRGPLAVEGHVHVATIEFDRPERACRGTSAGSGQEPSFCPAEGSLEVGVGFGASVSLEIRGPLHLSWGLNVAFTDPQFDQLEPQTMVTMPFGVLLTWTEWSVRPVLEGLATPFVLLPDGVKSVMFGGRLGAAVRVGEVDLALTVGYATADALRPVDLRLSVIHIP